MKKYEVITNTKMIIEADDEDKAREIYWEKILGETQERMGVYFEENTSVSECENE